jgi:hypothetical protein
MGARHRPRRIGRHVRERGAEFLRYVDEEKGVEQSMLGDYRSVRRLPAARVRTLPLHEVRSERINA